MRIALIVFALLFGVVETFQTHGDKVKAAEPEQSHMAQIHKNYEEHPQGITGQTIIIPLTTADARHETFEELNRSLAADHMPQLEEFILKSGKIIWIQTFIDEN